MASTNSWATILTGRKAGPFELNDCLGEGGFAIVMEGIHDTTDEHVAVKLLKPNPDATQEFANEGRLLGQLSGSTNVVHLHESGNLEVTLMANGASVVLALPYHVLELAQGCLEALVNNRHRLDWTERLILWRGVVRGVHQMHLRQIAHRDLKSENCLLFERPKNLLESKVGDLGRSRDMTAAAALAPLQYLFGRGDLRFAPPEFIAVQGSDTKETHICADLYGLGSVLFELATGQCLTAMALGPGPQLVKMNSELVQQGLAVDLSGMRANYEPAFQLFERSVPTSIRAGAGTLLRQLCDPVPSSRRPKPKFSSSKSLGTGLEWLLTRADILTRTLSAQDPSGRRARLRKGA